MGNEKGSDFAFGFWAEDSDAAKAVCKYWEEKYDCKYFLIVGTVVYCGTEQGIKHAGINLK